MDIRRHVMRVKSIITYARAPAGARSLLQQQLNSLAIWRITNNGPMYIPDIAQLSRFVLSKVRTSNGNRLRIIAAYCFEWEWCVIVLVLQVL